MDGLPLVVHVPMMTMLVACSLVPAHRIAGTAVMRCLSAKTSGFSRYTRKMTCRLQTSSRALALLVGFATPVLAGTTTTTIKTKITTG
jgi:hypothetical protein